jgi:hypothetical protein
MRGEHVASKAASASHSTSSASSALILVLEGKLEEEFLSVLVPQGPETTIRFVHFAGGNLK